MKKALILFGWFFLFQHSWEPPAMVHGAVGLFESAAKCEAARAKLATLIAVAEVEGGVGPCIEQKDI